MKPNDFVLIAHRGYSSEAPENTLASFWMAIERGYPHIELDVELTKDGVPVIFHDELIDRTTDSSGKISDYTLEEISVLDDGSWFSKKYDGEKIPTLRQVLSQVADLTHLHVELKSSEEELPQLVAKELGGVNMLHTHKELFAVPGLTITSFNIEQLQRSLQINPDVGHAWLVKVIDDDVINQAESLGVVQLCLKASNASKNQVKNAEEHGFSVRGWGVQNEADLMRLYRAGAQGATVNWPDKAKRFLQTD